MEKENTQEKTDDKILIPIIDDNSLYEIFIPPSYRYIIPLFGAFGFNPQRTLESAGATTKQFIVIENLRMLNKFLNNIILIKKQSDDRLINSVFNTLVREKQRFLMGEHCKCRVVGDKYYVPVAIYFSLRKM